MSSEKMLPRLRLELKKISSPTKAKSSAWFFKTGPGQYGEGDVFIGATVPEQRKIAKQYRTLALADIKRLLDSEIHEERLIALFILVDRYGKSTDGVKDKIFTFYLKNKAGVNNWDLVDSSAPYILGEHLKSEDKNLLFDLAKSHNLWERRMAIVATFSFIKAGDFAETLKICRMLIYDKQDLIHKACGWMLREIGKRDSVTLYNFLDDHHKIMPRTMLRYAIENMKPKLRAHYMKK